MSFFTKKKVLVPIVLVILVAVVYFLIPKNSDNKVSVERPVIEIKRETIERSLYVNGVVRPFGVVDIFPTTYGTVVNFIAKEGDSVKKGDPLFELRPDKDVLANIEVSKTNIERNRIERDLILSKIEQQKKAGEFVASSSLMELDAQLQRATFALKDSEMNLRNMLNNLGIKGDSNIITVIATTSGVITLHAVDVGATVQTNQKVMVLSNLDSLIVRANVSELDYHHLNESLKVLVSIKADTSKKYEGEIVRFSQVATRVNDAAVFELDVSIKEPDSFIRVNMSAFLDITLERKENVLALPHTAIASYKDNAVVDMPNTGYVKVNTGVRNDYFVEVLENDVIKEGVKVHFIDFATIDLNALGRGELGKSQDSISIEETQPAKDEE